MESLDKFYKNGWILYCPECNEFIKQSDPQNSSLYKQVIIDREPCEKCTKAREAEEQEAQQIMGRLGTPKETK